MSPVFWTLRARKMKKIIYSLFCILFGFGLSACSKGNISHVATHPVESELYTEQEINDAIAVIKHEFQNQWNGCTLKEIYYAGDKISQDHQEWAERNNAEDAIVLLSSFDVDSSGGDGSLNPNSTYDHYMWILVRDNDDHWQHVDHGY